MKALVTGSSGFIGSHLVEALLEAGFEVAALQRSSSDQAFLKGLPVRSDVVDYAKPETLVKSKALDGVDYVFHTAGVTKRVTKEQFLAGNVEPTQNLLEALIARKSVPQRFVFLSSQAALGPSKSIEDLKSEDHKAAPIELYGESKFIAEQVVHEYGATIPYTIIRPSSVYGPRDVDFLNIFKQITRGLNVYAGNRDKYISIIYVSDLVRGILAAAFSEKAANQLYNLCDDAPVCWQEIHTNIVELTGKRVFTIDIPAFFLTIAGKFGDLYSKASGRFSLINSQKIRLALPKYWLISNQKSKEHFDFTCEVSLNEGLRQTLQWYRQNKWI